MLNRLSILLTSLFVFLAFSTTPVGAYFAVSKDNLNLPKDQNIDETAYIAGSNIIIDSPIKGDLFCAGRTVVVNANIDGDIICVAQNMIINSEITGNIRSAAQNLTINGLTTKNITVASQNLSLGQDSVVGGDLTATAADISIFGQLGRDALLMAQTVNLMGSIERNTKIEAETINLSQSSHIGGNLEYLSQSPKKFDQGIVDGETKFTKTEQASTNKETSRSHPAFTVAKLFFSVIFFSILGLILVKLLPQFTNRVLKSIQTYPYKSFFLGLAIAVATPIVCFLVFITIIGIPFSLLGFLFFAASIVISRVFAAILLGQVLTHQLLPNQKNSSLAWVFIGVPVTWAIFHLPVIGSVASILAILTTLGAAILSLKSK